MSEVDYKSTPGRLEAPLSSAPHCLQGEFSVLGLLACPASPPLKPRTPSIYICFPDVWTLGAPPPRARDPSKLSLSLSAHVSPRYVPLPEGAHWAALLLPDSGIHRSHWLLLGQEGEAERLPGTHGQPPCFQPLAVPWPDTPAGQSKCLCLPV